MRAPESRKIPIVPMSSFCNFGLISAILMLLTVFFETNGALLPSEEAALREILHNLPDLYSVPSWATLDNNGVQYGSSWNNSFNLCQRDGYDYYGVFCLGGHVAGLMITTHWGKSTSGSFSASSGLTFLTNVTSNVPASSLSQLFSVLARLPLKHVAVDGLDLAQMNNLNVLRSFSGIVLPNYEFVAMPNLQSLKIAFSSVIPDLSPICASPLIELELNLQSDLGEEGNSTKFTDLVNCSPLIEKASFNTRQFQTSTIDLVIVSSALKRLDIQVSNLIPSLLIVNCSSLEELFIMYGKNAVELETPNLKHLNLRGWSLPMGVTSMTKLESFAWASSYRIPDTLPDMSFAPNLRSFDLGPIMVDNPNNIWPSLPVTIESVRLNYINCLQTIALPSSWTSLTSLQLFTPDVPTFSELSLSQLHSLEELVITGESYSMDFFFSFPNLKKLQYTPSQYLPGIEIPENFFASMDKLTEVEIHRGKGTIPWYGFENLSTLSLSGSFSYWPSLVGTASNLKRLAIRSGETMMPTDTAFRNARMDNLESLQVWTAGSKEAPFFWKDAPSIENVDIAITSAPGPLHLIIEAPRLRVLSLLGFCGPLPDFGIPTHLEKLSIGNSQFAGSIPSSWEQNLSILSEVNLAGNFLNGTIPSQLFEHHSGYRRSIYLENNNFVGPLWNMSSGVPWDSFAIGGTGLDVCLQDPDSSGIINSTTCSMQTLTKCPSQCPSFWQFCKPITCKEQTYTPRIPPLCTSPNADCALPQPGSGFECNRGTWILLGDLTSEITLPPLAGAVIVFGNLSNNGTITYSGTGTSIEVQGCVLAPPTQFVIELSPNSAPGNATLLKQHGDNCSVDLSSVPVVLSPIMGCKQFRVSTTANPSSLTVVLSLYDQCTRAPERRNWIILGSTLGGFLVLLAITGLLLHLKSPGFRAFIRTGGDFKKALAAKKQVIPQNQESQQSPIET